MAERGGGTVSWHSADQLLSLADELDAAVSFRPRWVRPDARGVLVEIDPADFEDLEEEKNGDGD